jgi:hypothetical protein
MEEFLSFSLVVLTMGDGTGFEEGRGVLRVVGEPQGP